MAEKVVVDDDDDDGDGEGALFRGRLSPEMGLPARGGGPARFPGARPAGAGRDCSDAVAVGSGLQAAMVARAMAS